MQHHLEGFLKINLFKCYITKHMRFTASNHTNNKLRLQNRGVAETQVYKDNITKHMRFVASNSTNNKLWLRSRWQRPNSMRTTFLIGNNRWNLICLTTNSKDDTFLLVYLSLIVCVFKIEFYS